MLGSHTRLRLDEQQKVYLDAYLNGFSAVCHTAYRWVQTKKISISGVYSFAKQKGLTAHQSNSVVYKVGQWMALDSAQCKNKIQALMLRIDALEQAVKVLDQKINQKSSGNFRTPQSREQLCSKRFQKYRILCSKREQLKKLEEQQKQGHCSRTFGGKKLLKQRQCVEDPSSPWSLESWRQEWNRKRQGSVSLVGDGAQTSGNVSAQIVFEGGQATLHLRLLDTQVQDRMEQAALDLGIPVDKLPHKMSYKRLSLPVSFTSKDQTKIEQAQQLKLPITVQISQQLTPKGKRQRLSFSRGPNTKKSVHKHSPSPSKSSLPEMGYYVHVSFDLPAAPAVASRHQGCLGVDLNALGLSYAAVGPDGNLLTIKSDEGSKKSIKGDIELHLNKKTSNQSRHALCQAAIELVKCAKTHRLAIAIEDLNFAKKKARLREMPSGYARMLSSFTTNGFADILLARCKKEGVVLHRVDPAWSSVAGFAKYGLSLNLSTDQAGAFVVGRAGVLGNAPVVGAVPTHAKSGKKLSPKFIRELEDKRQQVVIRYTESVCFSKPLPVQRQRMLDGQKGLSWKNVRKVLGKREAWAQAWSSLAAVPASAQKKRSSSAIRTPKVSGRPARSPDTLRSRDVKPERLFVS